MKCYRTLYCLVIVGLCSTFTFALPGSGTAEDPYRIQSMDDFDEFRNDSGFWNQHIRLECELDFTGRTYYAACIEYFRGVFDGNHQPIRNLRFDGRQEHVGFFGSVYSAEIYDVDFVTPNMDGYMRLAVLCGYAETSVIHNCTATNLKMRAHRFSGAIVGLDLGSTISRCNVSGEIIAYADYGDDAFYIGGIIGYASNNTAVEDCRSEIVIKPYLSSHKIRWAGGLIGNLGLGSIRRSSSIATITGHQFLGGLVGETVRPAVVIEDCFAEATVSGSENIGGLIGRNGNSDMANNAGGTVRRCSSKSTVTCSSRFGGGLIGYNYGGGPILQCGAQSNVSGSSYLGGLIGYSEGRIEDCYAVGTVSCSYMSYGGLIGLSGGHAFRCFVAVVLSDSTLYRGGLIGQLWGTGSISFSFWNTQIQSVSEIPSIADKRGTATDIYSKTTAEMMTQSTFTDYGWDFTNETANGTADLWRLCTDGTNYPHLSWEFPRQDLACPDGVGIEDLLVFSAQWLATGLSPNTGPDFTGDGNVTLEDLVLFGSFWLKSL